MKANCEVLDVDGLVAELRKTMGSRPNGLRVGKMMFEWKTEPKMDVKWTGEGQQTEQEPEACSAWCYPSQPDLRVKWERTQLRAGAAVFWTLFRC